MRLGLQLFFYRSVRFSFYCTNQFDTNLEKSITVAFASKIFFPETFFEAIKRIHWPF